MNVETPIRMHWPFGSNRYGWRAAYDSFESGTLVRWGAVGRLILMWGAILCLLILVIAALIAIT